MRSIQDQIDFLGYYLTDRRKNLIDQVLSDRTDHVTIVLEDVYHAQNISAALRTAECFGVQDIHLIENLHEYAVNPRIVRGATKWLSLHKYGVEKYRDPSAECIHRLRESGYTIYATSPASDAISLPYLDVSDKAAFIFGTEFSGVTETAARLADHTVTIPMKGFTESFNISVSVALVLQHVIRNLDRLGVEKTLSPERMEMLKFEWYQQSVKRSDMLLKRFNEV